MSTAASAIRTHGLRLRDHGVTPLFALVLATLTIGAQLGLLAYLLLIMHMGDGVLETRNPDTVLGFVLLFVFLVVVSGLFVYLRWLMIASVAERLALRLQAVTLQAAVRTAVRLDAVEGATMLQDIATVQAFLRSSQPSQALELLVSLAALGILFYIDTGIGLLSAAGILGSALLGFLMHRATRGAAAEARQQMAQTSAELGGQLVHPDLTRGMGMLQATMLRWQPRYDEALAGMSRVKQRTAAVNAIDHLFSGIFQMAVKVYVCFLIFSHVGTVGMLFAVYLISGVMFTPFGNLARSWQGWSFALQSWRRIRQVLRDCDEPPVLPPDPSAPPGLLIERLGFHPERRPRPIIADLTLRLAPGTVVTIEGPNGVGKSTLVRLVLGLMAPTSGTVRLDGQDTYHCDRGAFGARIGYLPQDVQLLEATVFQNIGRGPDAPPEAVVKAARMAGAHEMIGRLPLGYQTPSGATSGLSAGQRRLIGLARALYGDPRLLVLDEPEVGLDGYARVAMRAAVRDLRQGGGVILIVTHEPDTWRDIADLRLVLGPGGTWQVQPRDGAAGDETKGAVLAALH